MLRALAIFLLAGVGLWLFLDAAVNGAREYQLAVAALMLIGAVGLVATWFWSPF
jgi:hypothetical protein